MNIEALPQGDVLQLGLSRRKATVSALLGAGGQGAVYEVRVDGKSFALKWYHRFYLEHDAGLSRRIDNAIFRGSPGPRFLWPLEKAYRAGDESFGYLMPLRSASFHNMRDLIAPPPRRLTPSLTARANACCLVADSFLKLHAKGLCYQDINFGNIFLDPVLGDICICDNDNVDVNGERGGVFGTKKFMAPEIVRAEKRPDANTDLYSLAILLFYILHNWHALDGRREAELKFLDNDSEVALYGTAPLFMFDPADPSNGPVEGLHDAVVLSWRSLTDEVRELFVRSFSDGIRTPMSHRVMEGEWRGAMVQLRDSLARCTSCGHEQAVTGNGFVAPGAGASCLLCGEPLDARLQLVLGNERVLMTRGASLTRHHLGAPGSFEVVHAVASVEPHPARNDVLGLRNGTTVTWNGRLPDGKSVAVPPSKTVRLAEGLEIDFGTRRGKVECR